MKGQWETVNTQVCPWWFCPAFDNPLRRLIQPPGRILSGMVASGQRAVDLGCGMGYFTIQLAKMVRPQGVVEAVDLQPQMLKQVQKRAVRAGVDQQVRLRQCAPQAIGLEGPVDFMLIFWMAHEVADQAGFFSQVHALLKPDGRVLLAEPLVHVAAPAFEQTLRVAQEIGLRSIGPRQIAFSRAMVFTR